MVEDDNSAARKSVSVLVVDDNLVNSSLARTQLERLGYSAEVANDGYGALEAVALRRYDIILMDCEMPGMDGYTATAEIRRREPTGRRTAIIAMTAHAMASMRARCLAAGMDDFLAKPVKLLPLAATLDRWRSVNPRANKLPRCWRHRRPNLTMAIRRKISICRRSKNYARFRSSQPRTCFWI
jgi:CheY-like chemotaxis protein